MEILVERRPEQFEGKRPAAGFTLLELVVASASATVLMVGLASSLYIAGESLEVVTSRQKEESLQEGLTVAERVIRMIKHDLQSAIEISELTTGPNPLPDPLPDPPIPTSVTMKVPDRNEDGTPETIRYRWSGISGDSITQEYNGGTPASIATNVQNFSLAWVNRLIKGTTNRPFVLFVSEQIRQFDDGTTVASSAEQDRIAKIEGWGFHVTTISQEATQAEFDAQLILSNVVYVSGETAGATIGSKLNAAKIGVVTESFANAASLGFYSSLSAEIDDNSTIDITNERHYITTGCPLGGYWILNTDQTLKWTNSTLTSSAVTLTKSFGSAVTGPSLIILDADDQLADGTFAAGRRCQLPWGEYNFDSTDLRPDGEKLMRRSIEWASGEGEDSATEWVQYQEFTETQGGNNATSITLNTPPGSSEGDLLIAVVTTDGDTEGSLGPPVGWSEVLVKKDKFSSVTLGVWWKLVGAAELATSPFTWTGSERAYGTIMRFTGHDPNNPIHATATNTGVSNSPTAPALTTTVADCLILRIGAFDQDNIIPGDAGMAGHTTISANESDNGDYSVSAAVAFQMQAHEGNCGTAMFGLSGKEEYRTLTIAIPNNPN